MNSGGVSSRGYGRWEYYGYCGRVRHSVGARRSAQKYIGTFSIGIKLAFQRFALKYMCSGSVLINDIGDPSHSILIA